MKTREEAIKELGCEKKNCIHLDKDGAYTFCRVVFTEESCLINYNIDE